MTQSSLFGDVGVSWRGCALDEANAALVTWGHKMGPMNRPDYGDLSATGLYDGGQLVAVAMVAGLVRASVAGCPWLTRDNAMELARLCAARPGLCRVALRLWREFTFPRHGKAFAVSYQDADLHTGNTYRFDGWQRVSWAPGGTSTDQRTGRKGRNKWVWVWPPRIAAADPIGRQERLEMP